MIKSNCFSCLLSMVAVLAIVQTSSADVILTFDPHPGDGQWADQAYGDNVSSASDNGYEYGDTDGSFTPNVTVEYGDSEFDLVHYSTSYGDLTNILYRWQSGDLIGRVHLVAGTGHRVKLHSFDLAGWPAANYTINSISVTDECGNVLFEELDAEVIGNTDGTPDHTTIDFSEPLQGRRLVITFDSSNLGSDVDNIGIDNIRFDQVAAPGTGDVNQDGTTDLLDVAPFVQLLSSGGYQVEADINGDGAVNLLDVGPFVDLLACS